MGLCWRTSGLLTRGSVLPSLELLDMQWVLQRLVGMSGAAGWPTFTVDDDDNFGETESWLIAD